MSQLFELQIGKTYATLSKVFSAGEVYTAEQIGDVNAVSHSGEPFWAEVGSVPPQTPVEEVEAVVEAADPLAGIEDLSEAVAETAPEAPKAPKAPAKVVHVGKGKAVTV